MCALQTAVLDAAETTGATTVDHPMLDRVKRVSTAPDNIASFFTSIFHRDPQRRLTVQQAAMHPWLFHTFDRLTTAWNQDGSLTVEQTVDDGATGSDTGSESGSDSDSDSDSGSDATGSTASNSQTNGVPAPTRGLGGDRRKEGRGASNAANAGL